MFKIIFVSIGAVLVIVFGLAGYLVHNRQKKKKASGKYQEERAKRNYKWYNKWIYHISDNWDKILYLTSAITLLGVIITAVKWF